MGGGKANADSFRWREFSEVVVTTAAVWRALSSSTLGEIKKHIYGGLR